MKRIQLLLVMFLCFQVAKSQHDHHFSEPDFMLNENIKKAHPEWAEDITKAEQHLEQFSADFLKAEQNNASRAATHDYIIPVVVHILHQNGNENVTNKEVRDAMRILNEDFKLENLDKVNTISNFQNIMGDARIEFRLARKDPNGNPTNGIDRIETPLTNNAGENSKLNTWPRDTYLNIWLVNSIANGAAGYTFLPSGAHRSPQRDGIILLYNYFSSIRKGSPRLSRALTHEVGHWLNLPHPWGGTNNPGLLANCSDDDGVFDTPNTEGWTSCNLNGSTCGSLDNVQNFMSYSYCATMFTEGQVSRMHAALNTWVAERDDLVSKENNEDAGVLGLTAAEFESDRRVVCVGSTINFNDVSPYGAESWSWEFEGGVPNKSSDRNPIVEYNSFGSYDVKLTVSDGLESKTILFEDYIQVYRSVGNFLPVEENFESLSENIFDSWTAENEDNDAIYWQVMQGGTAPSGTNYFGVQNFNNLRGMIEGFISPAIDLSNIVDPEISFKIATAEKDDTGVDGYLKVYTSSDCGKTWNQNYSALLDNLAEGKKSTTEYTPSAIFDWKTQTIDNFRVTDKIENLLLKFEVENINGNNVYIDDIEIYGRYATEPLLEFPINGMDSVSSTIYLDWKSVPFVTNYEVQVSPSPSFSSINKTSTLAYINEKPFNEDTRFKIENLASNTTYYWRVRTTYGSTISNWSEVWEFTTSINGIGHEFLDGEEFINSVDLNTTSNIDATLFPNPADDNLTIRFSNAVDNGTIEVINLFGVKVLEQSFDEQAYEVQLFTENIAAGIYLVNIKVDGYLTTKKITIQ